MDEQQDIRIVVGQRGWVHVGKYRRDGQQVTLERAQCIRRWGTTKGLGQIAAEGPTPDTKLEPVGTLECHELAVVHTLTCDASAWAKTLGL